MVKYQDTGFPSFLLPPYSIYHLFGYNGSITVLWDYLCSEGFMLDYYCCPHHFIYLFIHLFNNLFFFCKPYLHDVNIDKEG